MKASAVNYDSEIKILHYLALPAVVPFFGFFRELVRNADTKTTPQTYWFRSHFNKIPG